MFSCIYILYHFICCLFVIFCYICCLFGIRDHVALFWFGFRFACFVYGEVHDIYDVVDFYERLVPLCIQQLVNGCMAGMFVYKMYDTSMVHIVLWSFWSILRSFLVFVVELW